LALLCAFLAPLLAEAQDERGLTLRLSRDWGFGGFGQIQGLFSMRVTGPEDLVRVQFMIDGLTIAEDEEPPFSVQFHTDNYPSGMRTMSAAGETADGGVLQSNEIGAEFLSAEAAGKATTKFIIPLMGLVVLILALTAGFSLVAARKRKPVAWGQPRKYGLSGGTICPKCGRPFPLSLLGLNMGLGKFTACPHCGKWSVVRSRPLAELRAAEASELERAGEKPQVAERSSEEKLQQDLDDSRYQSF
jgi:DNA-directed RNA polymerase subunit RPC12/RpoP